jgi:peptide/nickel transport system permease protein
MLAYIIRRLASTVLVMGIVAVFVFLLLHLSPGDPAAIIAGDNASGEQIAGIRKQLGLDDPLPVQFSLGHRGAAGRSRYPIFQRAGAQADSQRRADAVARADHADHRRDARRDLRRARGLKVGTAIDRALMVLSVIGFSVPVFVVGHS